MKITYFYNCGEEIKEIRTKLGIRSGEICKRLGVKHSNLVLIETQNKRISEDKLRRILLEGFIYSVKKTNKLISDWKKNALYS